MLKQLLSGVFMVMMLPLQAQTDYFSSVVLPDSTQSPFRDSLTEYSASIRPEDIRNHVYFLASDSCEGRELGTKGNDRASAYIATQFRTMGIGHPPSLKDYFQEVGFRWMYWDKLVFKINEVPYKQLWDYLSIPSENGDLEMKAQELVFLGYGIDDPRYSDYGNRDYQGKIALIYKGEPKNKHGKSYLTKSDSLSEWSFQLKLKQDAAARHGIKLLLVIEDSFKEWVDQKRSEVISPQVTMGQGDSEANITCNMMYLSSTTVTMLLGKNVKKVIKARDKINKSGKSQALSIPCALEVLQKQTVRSEKGKNILAFIPGKKWSDELILISAHYDHIGKRGSEVFNGADDNASGTSSVLEIAEAYANMSKMGIYPDRSMMFALMTGEEKGLLGSMYYVNHPVFPLAQTRANINIDMIGRTDDHYQQDSNYVYVIGADRINPILHQSNIDINQRYAQLKLDYRYNAESDPNRYYYRSDHYNFAEKGIPAIFFFSGVHKDYHRTTDDPEKIMFGKTAQIAKHIFYLSWALSHTARF